MIILCLLRIRFNWTRENGESLKANWSGARHDLLLQVRLQLRMTDLLSWFLEFSAPDSTVSANVPWTGSTGWGVGIDQVAVL